MSEYYDPEVVNISPQWNRRDNKGADERLQLSTVTVTVKKSAKNGRGWRYELTYSLDADGIARLSKFTNPRDREAGISPRRLATAVPLAEAAVSDLLNDINPAKLALKPYASEFDDDVAVPDRTTETEALENNND